MFRLLLKRFIIYRDQLFLLGVERIRVSNTKEKGENVGAVMEKEEQRMFEEK